MSGFPSAAGYHATYPELDKCDKIDEGARVSIAGTAVYCMASHPVSHCSDDDRSQRPP
jgi:hypothetical protein